MMFKRISLLASLLFFLFGANVFAHSHLDVSSPKNGAVLTEPFNDINLFFETNVEQTSTLTLTDANGKTIQLEKVSVEGKRLIGLLKEDLANGEYKIHWKIIGTDGHPLEGDIAFSVQLTATEATAVEKSENQSDNATLLTKKADINEPSFKDYVVPGAVGLIIVVGFGSYWLIFRRKQA